MIAPGPIKLRGPVLELALRFHAGAPPEEASLEGPAGTGKTQGLLWVIRTLMECLPGLRVGLGRKVKADLAETALRTWEEEVLGPMHPCLQRRKMRSGRSEYTFPNGSILLPFGMDNPSRTFGSHLDMVYLNEGIEFSEDEYELLHRGLRGALTKARIVTPWGVPICPVIVDTNPGDELHWLNRRPDRPGSVMERYCTRHEHNPAIFEDDMVTPTPAGRAYLAKLDRLTGHRLLRMRHGKWVSAEGIMWPNFDRAAHVVTRARAGAKSDAKPFGEHVPDFRRFVGAIDWGHRAPGVFQLWGVEDQKIAANRIIPRAWLLMEWYRTGWEMPRWAEVIKRVHRRFPMNRIVADPADPGNIAYLNTELGPRGGRDVGSIVIKANNRHAGKMMVNDLFDPSRVGGPRLLILEDSLQDPDPELLSQGKPTRLIEEIPGYRYAEAKDGRPVPEDSDKACVDHAADAARYLTMDIWASEIGKQGKIEVPNGLMDEEDRRLLAGRR